MQFKLSSAKIIFSAESQALTALSWMKSGENKDTNLSQTLHHRLQKPYRIPSHPEPFMDVVAKWFDDKVFTEQRLAGANPMAIQRVCYDKPGKLLPISSN